MISQEVQDMIRKMLTLDQKLRWSARQLLSHPWITAGDAELEQHDLTGSLAELKRYNARRRLRAAADAVIMANRMAKMTASWTGNNDAKSEEPNDNNNDNNNDNTVIKNYTPPSKFS